MKLTYPQGSWEFEILRYINDNTVQLEDHLGGIDNKFRNAVLEDLANLGSPITVWTEYLFDENVKANYPSLDIKFDAALMIRSNHFSTIKHYLNFNPKEFKYTPKVNFLCSFSKRSYLGRVWLLSWLYELGWFNADYCSKHFAIPQSPVEIEQLYSKYISNNYNLLRKKIARQQFQKTIVKFEKEVSASFDSLKVAVFDLERLADKNSKSFVNLVAETLPTHMVPFPTEKFLYPIACRTLWVAYAQPGYHKFITEKMGFRQYQCFDYEFDQEVNHTERLRKVTDMLDKFSKMHPQEWDEIYQQEKETIDFNFNHLHSGAFIQQLEQYNQVN